jgi:signal transduction histidine kinase/CheY-like chemotaxis protein
LRPIRVYLLVLVLGAMLPGVLLTGILVWRSFANNRAIAERRLLESARVDASALDREFDSTISVLQTLATSPSLDRDDLAAFHQDARRGQATQPGWYTLLLLSLDGRQLVSTRVPWGTPLLPVVEPESLQRVIATRRPVVGVIRQGRTISAYLFAIRVPVVRDNILKYVLSAVVRVESLARVIPRQLPDSEEWTRSILDSEGTIAVRTRGAEGYIGAKASELFRNLMQQHSESVTSQTTREGIPVYAAFSRGLYGWTSVVVVPRAVLDGPLWGSMAGLLFGGTLLMLCSLVVVLFVSRLLATDLAGATTAAEAVADGRPLPPTRAHVAETARLQRSLTTAASLLERRSRERDEEMARADTARREAEEANQTKDQFLAVLGHELRNPLTPALTAVELMKARDPNAFTREREVLERQMAHMARLVNDLLDVSRLARGKIQLDRRRFELRESVDRAVDMARPIISQHRHTLDVSVPATGLAIDGDIDRIVQVLSNLLTNAAKYTPPGGHIALLADESGDRIVIACEDDGPGIPADLAPMLFDPFAQGPRALDRREGGLGLGLALSRTFTELHGGTVRVEPRGADGGSRFVVTLPRTRSGADVAAPEPAALDAGSDSQRILLVDDNADACDMLRAALERAGHIVCTAANGPDAIDLADAFRPEIGVLDIGLPGMDGYELAARLRDMHAGIRLIALTGYGQAGDLKAAIAAGFDAHCAKPVTITGLLGHIEGRKALFPTDETVPRSS